MIDREIKKIEAEVYGFYGGEDNRVNAKLPKAQKLMKKFKKFYDVVIYDGAGHAFMRHGDDPDGSEANKTARDKAWKRVKEVLSKL